MVELIDENGPNLTFPDLWGFLKEEYEFSESKRDGYYIEISLIYHRIKAR